MSEPTPQSPAAAPTSTDHPVLLAAHDVTKTYQVRDRRGRSATLTAVDHVTLEVHAGETLGLVGESGCGKSTLARCLVRLEPVTSGRVVFDGVDVTTLNRRRLRRYRRGLQMVFQDPYSSLNPRRRAQAIVEEPMRVHRTMPSAAIAQRARELLGLVGLDAELFDRYPHEFSGGQRQRIGIARALALGPKVVVADEPVSALDVSIQAQVLNLFSDLQDELGLTYLFIAHDLGVVRHISTRIGVMYLGELVELGPADAVFTHPRHPYTEALISATPEIDDGTSQGPARERIVVAGEVPNPIDRPSGCAFSPRCPHAADLCHVERPRLAVLPGGRQVACHFPRPDAVGTVAAPPRGA